MDDFKLYGDEMRFSVFIAAIVVVVVSGIIFD